MTNRNLIFRRIAWIGLATGLAMSVPFASAQEEKHQVSEKVGEALQKLKPLQDAKNYQGMLDLVSNQLAGVAPTSYDAAYLLDLRARLLIQTDQIPKAIEPWAQALKLSDQFHYFDDKMSLDITKYLAQLIFSEATTTKDKALQQQQITDSAMYLKRYLDKAPKPESETQMLYAQILYYQATSDSSHVNQGLLQEARQIIERGMLGSIHPKEGFYRLLLAVVQQQNDFVRSAELMELLLKEYPTKKDIWPMLFGTYVNLAGTAKTEDQRREFYVRGINTLERAQALGFMNTPRDNYNLVTLYINAGAFGMATDLLHKGLEAGTIESTAANWRILGAYYQQANKELMAISALKEATKLFPKDGSLELLIGQIYQQLENTKEAHDHFQLAVEKGNTGDRPHQAYLFLAWSALELGDYDGALKAINEAAAMPDGAKDPQLKTLRENAEAMIADRERIKAAAEAAAKK